MLPDDKIALRSLEVPHNGCSMTFASSCEQGRYSAWYRQTHIEFGPSYDDATETQFEDVVIDDDVVGSVDVCAIDILGGGAAKCGDGAVVVTVAGGLRRATSPRSGDRVLVACLLPGARERSLWEARVLSEPKLIDGYAYARVRWLFQSPDEWISVDRLWHAPYALSIDRHFQPPPHLLSQRNDQF